MSNPFLDQNDVNKRKSVVMYATTRRSEDGLHSVVVENFLAQNGFTTFEQALESVSDHVAIDVQNPFNINREKHNIAKRALRGVANYIAVDGSTGAIFENVETIQNSMTPALVHAGLTKTYLLYKSPASSLDSAILRKGDMYWLHPEYKNYITVLNFVGEQHDNQRASN